MFYFNFSSREPEAPKHMIAKMFELRLPEPETTKIQISGTYKLIERGEHFGDFLESLGMSRSYLVHLEDVEEKLTILEETPTNPNWIIILSTSEYFILSVMVLLFPFENMQCN